MTEHLRRSRVTKAFADAGLAGSFESAEARLDSVEICVVVGSAEARTAAGQAAVLTALATSIKSFGRATLACSDGDVLMIAAQPLGVTLAHAGEQLGARVVQACPSNITHAIHIGASPGQAPWRVFCWWDRWCAARASRLQRRAIVVLRLPARSPAPSPLDRFSRTFGSGNLRRLAT